MSLISELITAITTELETLHLPVPKMMKIIIPKWNTAQPRKYQNFGMVVLENNHAGIFFTNLKEHNDISLVQPDLDLLTEESPLKFIKQLQSPKLPVFNRMIGMGVINALSQYIMENRPHDPRDGELNSFDEIKATEDDHVGMVGFFRPLVRKFNKMQIPLTIIEQKEELVTQGDGWEVSLDPTKLQRCNKVIITATTLMNNSLDDILRYCDPSAWKLLVGPTAGILPEPLFHRGISLIGGSQVLDWQLLEKNMEFSTKWGKAVKKYCIMPKFR